MSKISEEVMEENTSTHVSKLPEIPEEAIKEMMLLLPVKSLLRFRCVSPSWLSSIDSPYFVKNHLSKSTPKIIINKLSCFYVSDINPVNPKPKAQTSVLKLCYPHSNACILASVNGVLLSHHDNSKPGIVFSLQDSWDVVLQNPYTRTFHKIPYVHYTWPGPKHAVCCPEKFVFALWYDALTDDYKVFRNCQFFGCSDGNPFYSQVHVYSLKTKSYKQIDPCPYYMKYEMADTVFVGGALHWVVSTADWDKSQWIASFDVSTQVYGLVEQPQYSSCNFKFNLHALGGCLSVVCTFFPSEHKEVWAMKEYGNVDSWCKLLSIRAADIGQESLGYIQPLLYSECGKKVLLEIECRTLLWYDIEKKNVEFVELDIHPALEQFQPFVHQESLVKLSCHGLGPGDEKKKAQDNDEKPHQRSKKRDAFLSKGFKLKL